ncbi:MAG TPA: YicC family protein, partial [Eubacteriaceae bacterium]|nr:YicC family protein [Eubacteriaceae bacterium]
MTGFGRSIHKNEDMEIQVEIKTINHRYRDFFIRIPRQINFAEDRIRKMVSEKIARGRIEIHIKYKAKDQEATTLSLNVDLARQYVDCLKTLKDEIVEITGEYNLSLVSKFPDVIVAEESEQDETAVWNTLQNALQEALTMLVESREQEGRQL